MNKEQQRIAIAEACGWTAEQDSNGYWRAVDPKHGNAVELWISERNVWSVGIPDYLNDLNAMHEAEKLLDGMDQITYLAKLHEGNHYCSWAGTCAPTTQRAEAFLKTLGLWKEEQ
jgi:hypothetical protein